MQTVKNIEWFKKEIEPQLKNYELQYRFYEQGDFGSLNQVLFESKEKGGNIDFWGLGWLGVFIWDYIEKEEILNTLLEPHQIEEKEKIFKYLTELL